MRIPPLPRSPKREIGVSLIELMIAIALGLVLVATIGNAYIAAKQGFRSLSALSRVQENARFAFDFMGEDIRMAGYAGGVSVSGQITQTTGAGETQLDLKSNPLRGYEKNGSVPSYFTASSIASNQSDALTIIHADTENDYGLTTADPSNCSGTNPCTLASALSATPAEGDTFVVADYTRAAVFQASSGSTSTVINHASGNLNPFYGDIQSRKVYPLVGVTYFIDTNPANEPALYRRRLGAAAPEELVEGISDMQILYGQDTNGDNSVDAYVSATGVTNWSTVLSVRITLTMKSREGEAVTSSGGMYQKNFTTTIAIRNRLL